MSQRFSSALTWVHRNKSTSCLSVHDGEGDALKGVSKRPVTWPNLSALISIKLSSLTIFVNSTSEFFASDVPSISILATLSDTSPSQSTAKLPVPSTPQASDLLSPKMEHTRMSPSAPSRSPRPFPRTPEARINLHLPGSATDMSQFSPAAKAKAHSLKRKASQLIEHQTRERPSAFYKWRLSVLTAIIGSNNALIDGHREALRNSSDAHPDLPAEAIATIKKENEVLEKEKSIIIREGKLLIEDIEDSTTTDTVEQAYMTQIYVRWRNCSEEAQKEFSKNKRGKWDRKVFKTELEKYLQPTDPNDPGMQWCNVVGDWVLKDYIKAAHIVPYAFQSKELDYLFGTEDSALASERNGIFLVRGLEAAFDNGAITVVPDGSLDSNPIEWKVVVLDDSILNQVFFESSKGKFRYHMIDGKRLTWQNNNRPARRYLYFRHAMACMHASIRQWPNFKDKLPAGTMWATPNKSQGYLRRSVLKMIARRIGDEVLDEDTLMTGTFTDTEPETGTEVHDQLAEYTIGTAIQDKIEGRFGGAEDSDDE
ncbi:MAG: hypothetical protein Q9166_003617 [cf. Caloplaca sp. 2 TL-2023]